MPEPFPIALRANVGETLGSFDISVEGGEGFDE